MNFPQKKLGNLLQEACKLKGVKLPAPSDLLLANMFGPDKQILAYREVCREVAAELKAAGFTHLEWANGELTEITPDL